MQTNQKNITLRAPLGSWLTNHLQSNHREFNNMPLPLDIRMKHLVYSLIGSGLLASSALADTTFDNTEKFAWSANTGWISFRHDRPSSPDGVTFGGAYLGGYAYSANVGWIHFGDGTPVNGHTYSNTGSDHGVNHDGMGHLSGFAWSANTGWINFGWATLSDPNRPRVNLLTGTFSGYAWSANTGWINLGTGILTTQSMQHIDSDNDGIADWWELKNFTALRNANANSDKDKDGVTDLAEYKADTDPNNPNSYLKIVSHSHNLGISETILQFTTTPSRLYRVEYSNDLGSTGPWIDSTHGTFSPDAGATTTKTITYPGNPKKFFRAVAVVPLTP